MIIPNAQFQRSPAQETFADPGLAEGAHPAKGACLRLAVQVRVDFRIEQQHEVDDRPEVCETWMRKRLLTCQPLSHYRLVGEGRSSVDGRYHRPTAARG